MAEQQLDAIVIGAGHNGLIGGAYLARAGKRVLVLERRDIIGGACVTEEVWPGYRVSTAAYLCSLLLPEIITDLELEKHGFSAYRRETAGFSPFADGSSLLLYPDETRARPALEKFCNATPEDVNAYFQLEADIERVANVMDRWMVSPPPSEEELKQSFAQAGIAELYAPFLEGSVRDLLDARFRDERLKAILATDGLIGTFGGPSKPGTAYVFLHHYLGKALGARGAWGYVRGGMGQITKSLTLALQQYGGEVRTNAPVKAIVMEAGRAAGVVLESGEILRAEVVLSNADPYRTFQHLAKDCLPEEVRKGIGESLVMQGGPSCKINLAVSELPKFACLLEREGGGIGPEHLGTVHICPDMDYLDRAFAETERGIPATEPMVEIYLQTATDASLTPPGKHILSLFTQYFPYHLAPGLNLDEEREKYADRVIALVGQFAPNVPGSILHRQILTPRDLEARFGLTGGHIFHGDLLPPTLWKNRPASGFDGAKTPVPGLYLCGSGAHPGGCVFGAPGYNAARTVLEA